MYTLLVFLFHSVIFKETSYRRLELLYVWPQPLAPSRKAFPFTLLCRLRFCQHLVIPRMTIHGYRHMTCVGETKSTSEKGRLWNGTHFRYPVDELLEPFDTHKASITSFVICPFGIALLSPDEFFGQCRLSLITLPSVAQQQPFGILKFVWCYTPSNASLVDQNF